MTDALINYLKTKATGHVLGIALAALACAGGYSWLQEHDARLLAEAAVKASNDRIAVLEKDKQDIIRAGQLQLANLQKQAEAVKTPAQAIAAIPSVSPVPLNPAPLPDAPSAVKVDAIPLFQALSQCKQGAVNLGTCQQQLKIETQVEAEKDTQIKALEHKPAFWKRFGKIAACGTLEAAPFIITKRPSVALPFAGAVALGCQFL
jgi:hypothetical protein